MTYERYEADRLTVDPILEILEEGLRKVADNFEQRNSIRKSRGDQPLTGAPFITVMVQTEDLTFENKRVFHVGGTGRLLDLYTDNTNDPYSEMVSPHVTVRSSAIVTASIVTDVNFLPVEFPMTKTDLDLFVDDFLTEAERILSTGTPAHKDDVSEAQRQALVDAAKPVNNFIFESPVGMHWERYTRAVSARNGQSTVMEMPATDKRLNRIVVVDDCGTRRGTPLLRFLTHGVPLEFLYTETHKVALDAYAAYVASMVRRNKN